MAYALKFGSYTFPNTFAVVSDPIEIIAPKAKIPRADGDVVATAYRGGKTVHIDGGLTNGVGSYTETGVRTLIDSLRAGIAGTQNLYFFDDRYYRNAQLISANFNSPTASFLKGQRVNCVFLAGDSYQYSTTTTSNSGAISASGQTLAVTAGGNSVCTK